MADGSYRDKTGNIRNHGAVKTVNASHTVYPGDVELIEWMSEYLGTSKSDVVRSAIRAFAAHLAFIEGSRQK